MHNLVYLVNFITRPMLVREIVDSELTFKTRRWNWMHWIWMIMNLRKLLIIDYLSPEDERMWQIRLIKCKKRYTLKDGHKPIHHTSFGLSARFVAGLLPIRSEWAFLWQPKYPPAMIIGRESA